MKSFLQRLFYSILSILGLSLVACKPCLIGERLKNGVCVPIECKVDQKLVNGRCENIICPMGERPICGNCRALPTIPDIDNHYPRIAIVTQFTSNLCTFADLAVENHIEYAKKHGYAYIIHEGRISGDQFWDFNKRETLFREGLYWQKVSATKMALDDQYNSNYAYDWILWLDADAIFTNFNRKIETIIDEYGGSRYSGYKHFILPRDESGEIPNIVINNGVYLLQNTLWSREFIAEIQGMYSIYKECDTPEQDAFQDYIYNATTEKNCGWSVRKAKFDNNAYDSSKLDPKVALVPQRVMDSFLRPSKPDDKEGAKWKPCDFIAHITGTPNNVRREEFIKLKNELPDCPE